MTNKALLTVNTSIDVDVIAEAIVAKLDSTEGVEAFEKRLQRGIPFLSRRDTLELSIAALVERLRTVDSLRSTAVGRERAAVASLEAAKADLLTVTDERDEFRSQLDEAQAQLPMKVGEFAVMVENDAPYVVGELVEVKRDLDEDGDYRVEANGKYQAYVRQSSVRRATPVEVEEATKPKPEPLPYVVGDKVRVLSRSNGTTCSVGEVVTVHDVGSFTGSTIVKRSTGNIQYLKPETLAKARVFNVGDPEPEDRDTITLTGTSKATYHGGEDETVELRFGRHSSYSVNNGVLRWWNVGGTVKGDHGSNSHGRWDYWLEHFGPLTEQL